MAFKNAGAGGDYPDPWRPSEEGERITGKVTRKEMAGTINGERPVIEVETENGPLTVWIGAGLKSLYSKVEVGHLVDITYEGEKVSEKSGRTFKSYNAQYDDGTE